MLIIPHFEWLKLSKCTNLQWGISTYIYTARFILTWILYAVHYTVRHLLSKVLKVLGYPELCHNRLDCFCFVLNLVGVEQN